ncbi:MAG: hypothetical protein QM779_12680 [Propionicimonas sp.]|uniref:hypothetical protein n=1 Tax=Propionicimonas sp. TaxID=1955623 RepID=UPI003D0A9B88
MSTMPWGTMNNWIRIEAEQRNAWTRLRVQDLRSAQVAREPRPALAGVTPLAAPAPLTEECPQAAA